MQALAMPELRKYNMDIACLSEVRISDSGHSVIKVPSKEDCYDLYHCGVVENTGSHAKEIALSEAALAVLLTLVQSHAVLLVPYKRERR